MRVFLSDLRHGLRGLSRDRSFAAAAVLTLALGIGSTVAVFGVADAVLLKPLPYRDPARLARVGSLHPVKNPSGLGASYMDVRDLRERNRSFETLAGVLGSSAVLGGADSAVRVDTAWVSWDFFQMLGFEPLAGRLFRPDEDREGGGSHVALLSSRLWRTRYGSAPSAVGSKILVEGIPYEVIGVVPDDELLLENAGLVLPLVNQAYPQRSGRAVDVAGRLRPGVTLAAARAELEGIARDLAREYPEENAGFSVAVRDLHGSLLGGRRSALLALSGAVALLLLIACANTANLLLARGAARRQELSVRAALGASRGRLGRQLFSESCGLALIGGLGGVAAASGLLDLIRRAAAGAIPRIETAGLDGRALAFALGACAATVLFFGLVPAVLTSRRAIAAGLRLAGRSAGADRLRALDGMVVVQTALCVVLLVGAGLLGRSYLLLSGANPGFSPERVLSLSVSLPRGVYRDLPGRTPVLERLISRIESLPGVRAAGLVGWLPSQSSMTMSFAPEGHPRLSRAQSPQAEIREISAGTFAALGIPILSGRGVSESDRADSTPVIVVNRQLAARFWPGLPAVGRHISLFVDGVSREVVGVVGDVPRMDRAAQTPDQMYVPFTQDPLYVRMCAVVRAETEPEALATAIARIAREIDPGIALSDLLPMPKVLSKSIAEPRFRTILVGFFAAAALLLASIGLYGVIAYSVARRRYEIGVRMALGASPREILRVFVGGGLRLALGGVAAGTAAALLATKLLRGLLYGIAPTDPASYAAAALVLLAMAFAASLVPARRAAGSEPLAALRSE